MTKTDDAATLIALGTLAFIAADVTHEALGHGIATWLVGGKVVLLTSSYVSTAGSYSRWIPAAGGLANVIEGLASLLALRLFRVTESRARYFLILLIAFNLLFATAYPVYSGVALFGDWAAVISGLAPAALWRTLLVLIGASGYYLTMRLVAVEIAPFCGLTAASALARLRRVTVIPYVTALAVAALAGSLNPRGWANILLAAVPAAAASFGLTQLDHFPAACRGGSEVEPRSIEESWAWIAAGIFAAAVFIAVLGPGIRFERKL